MFPLHVALEMRKAEAALIPGRVESLPESVQALQASMDESPLLRNEPPTPDKGMDPKDTDALLPVPSADTFIAHAAEIGLVNRDPADRRYVMVDSFDDAKAKVRQLAKVCGFQVGIDKTKKGGRRRLWVCTSKTECPFVVSVNQSLFGIRVKCTLEHNHPMHVHEKKDTRLTTYSTDELRRIFADSDLCKQSADVSKITGREIIDTLYNATGYTINANRASMIKHGIIAEMHLELERSFQTLQNHLKRMGEDPDSYLSGSRQPPKPKPGRPKKLQKTATPPSSL
ncbi:hypothetical protein ACHHYP_13940 [Achlya hypogyna]|uniref:Uncharacterized protein n=1 Tax=Achlya hypogyna TaxID=1202772 RepID=A0A1V9YE92_ACHHY|nr:hypothetical protein ACHHYP_13940 [Achlya hypogyna]